MDLADVLADPARSRALVCWNINPVASSPEQAALKRALARDDLLTVVCDLFLTDTAAYADYVLPAASFLECDDILPPYFHHTLSAQVKAADPPGEALRNAEIFRRLAAGMGFAEPELHETRRRAHRAPAGALGRRPGSELARAGTVRLYPEPRVQFADGFPTPEREDRARLRAGRGRRAPAPARAERRRAGARRVPPPALARVALADELDVRQRRASCASASAPRRSRCIRARPPAAGCARATRSCCATPPASCA